MVALVVSRFSRRQMTRDIVKSMKKYASALALQCSSFSEGKCARVWRKEEAELEAGGRRGVS